MCYLLDPAISAASHPVGELLLSELRLMDDARYPWLILIPRVANAREWCDLPWDQSQMLLAEAHTVAKALRRCFEIDKLNVATLGNQVAQLHLHVIGRRHDDPAWPHSVFGRGDRAPYAADTVARLVASLRSELPIS
ncbi:MAG: HIT domain-containing protein [Xanthomonadales bacterium]|jgi:diadenosine tetraphosphate (Ap4A) HIT family hydrolase|nr:HIT domain-containing protein [Xanthomonadales bacterium]